MLKIVHLNEVIAMSEKTNLADKPIPKEPANVACNICLTEIPKSVAVSSEADEYTQYFCGIECYLEWRGEAEETQTTPPAANEK